MSMIAKYVYIYPHGQVWGMGNGTSNMSTKVIDKYNLIFEVSFQTLELTFSLKFTYWSSLLTPPHFGKKDDKSGISKVQVGCEKEYSGLGLSYEVLSCMQYVYTHMDRCVMLMIAKYVYIYTHGQVWGMGNGTSNMPAKVIDKYNLIFEVSFQTLELMFSLKNSLTGLLCTLHHIPEKR